MSELDLKGREVKEHHKKTESPRVGQKRSGTRHRKSTYESGSAMNYNVKFTAMDNGAYQMTVKGAVVQTLVFNKDSYPGMAKKDYFLIKFTLDDHTTARDLEIPPNPMNAIWICTPRQVNPPVCPLSAVYDQEIYAVSTDPTNNTLLVRNEDMESETFQFTLRFLRKGQDPSLNSSYANYDPGGQNMNGGIGVR